MANAADIFQIGGRHVKLGEVSAAVALASQSANGKGLEPMSDNGLMVRVGGTPPIKSDARIGGNRSERACLDRRRPRNSLSAG